jgi:hypothetical protein
MPAADGSSPKTQRFDGPPPMVIDPAKRYTAEVATSKGTMVVALDAAGAPKTVNNFVFLARWHYYDGIVFHRIIPGFMLPGRRSRGLGPRWPGLPVRGRAAGTRPLRDRIVGHGQRRSQHQRQPVLHRERARRPLPAAQLLAVRQGGQGLDVVKAIEAVGSRSGAPSEQVTIESVTITEAD